MTDTLKKLRIFAASPSDVVSERAKLETVVASLKPTADYLGLTLEVVDWRTVVPDAGRPQQIIFDQLQPTSWDIFVGILWHRFGTPPGGKDPQTQKDYLSGTEEEFRTAYRLWKEFKKPHIVMYRCTRPIPVDADFAQAQRVKDFFKEIQDPQGEFRVLTQSFDTTESFEKLLLDNLQKVLLEYNTQVIRKPIVPDLGQSLTPKILDTLPRRAPFFGRKNEIAQAMRALSPEDRGWGVVIDGIGGIGKTALAVDVAYLCKEQGKFDAYVFASAKHNRLEPSGIKEMALAATTLDALVSEIARAIGQPGVEQLVGEQKTRAIVDGLRGRKALLIIDNLETLTTIEQNAIGDVLRNLPPDCKAIITSRRRTGEAAVTIRLERLDWDAARELIENEMARNYEVKRALSQVGEGGWKQLYDGAGGSPLALTWTIGLIRARGLQFESAMALLHDGNAESDLNAFIYSEAQKRMDPNERAALGALSFFAGTATFVALTEVANLDRRILDVALERLRALSLVDIVGGTTNTDRSRERELYELHPLTQRFAREDLAKDPEIKHEMAMRYSWYWVKYAEEFGGPYGYKTFDQLEMEWKNLDEAARVLWRIAAVQGETVGNKDAALRLNDLVEALNNFLLASGRWDERILLSEWAFKSMQALGDLSNAGRRAYRIAFIHFNRANTDEAERWANLAAEMWTRDGNRGQQATGMRMRGLVAQQRKDYFDAERLYQEAFAIYRDLGNEEWMATVLNDLGEVASLCKRRADAEQYYGEALALAKKVGDKEGQAIYAINLGDLALTYESWLDARGWFEIGLPLAQEVGHRDLTAIAQSGFARVWEAEGRVDLALPLAQEALKIYERLQHKDLAEARELVERLKGKAQPPS